jgi:hypothetical protein
MRITFAIFFVPALLFAASAPDIMSGPRTTPATVTNVSPTGAPQGTSTVFKIEGSNLAVVTAAYFSEPGMTARIVSIERLPDLPDNRLGAAGTKSSVDLGPLPQHNLVTLEVNVEPTAELGAASLRLQTPFGLTNAGRFVVEPKFPEIKDSEPNDDPEHAVDTSCPSILTGAISKPGDVDFYKFTAAAGDRIVFENIAMEVGSALRPFITILDANRKVVREFNPQNETGIYAQEFASAGTYFLKITDFERGGSARHSYRIIMGKLPVVVSTFPLGLQNGRTAKLTLNGWNLPAASIELTGKKSEGGAMWLRPQGSLNKIKLTVGNEPEVIASDSGPQSVPVPATINGRLTSGSHDFRFHANKGQPLILEVNAARSGSPLDSALEVLDSAGKPVERATIRAIAENSLTLSDRNSIQPGLRLLTTTGLAVGDYMMVGSEIIRIGTTPHNPDQDTFFNAFQGQRVAYFDTTAEGHAMDTPIYKVQILPPGQKAVPNGLPVVHLMYRNDDGGPGYGKDSLLHFTAPSDGEYIVRLTDGYGRKGNELTYRLSIRAPHPDYRLSLSNAISNVPAGGRVPVSVIASRIEGFDGPIHLSMKDLPPSFHAADITIPAGEMSGTFVLSADADAKLASAVPLIVKDDNGREVQAGDRLSLIALTGRSDIVLSAKTREITLQRGSKADVIVDIQRNGGYVGRVPIEVRDLPQEIVVANVGNNGVLINETENTRSFTLEALPNAKPAEQTFVVSGRVETRAGSQENTFAGELIHLVVK